MPRIPRPAGHSSLPTAPVWQDDAACRGTAYPEDFFPKTIAGVPMITEAEMAKAVCARCPVRSQCLAHALTLPEKWGVWGGLDEKERNDLLREARNAAKAAQERERAARKRQDRQAAQGEERADASAAA